MMKYLLQCNNSRCRISFVTQHIACYDRDDTESIAQLQIDRDPLDCFLWTFCKQTKLCHGRYYKLHRYEAIKRFILNESMFEIIKH